MWSQLKTTNSPMLMACIIFFESFPCVFDFINSANRVMVLHKAPKVIHTNVGKLLGKPEDYAMMALKVVLKTKNKIDASIPIAPIIPAEIASAPVVAAPVAEAAPAAEDAKTEKPPEKPQVAPKVAEPAVTLIKDLKKDQSKWTIKVRVTKKHDPKSCKAGTGKMQKIDVVDQGSSEISILMFDDAVAAVGENLAEGGVPSFFFPCSHEVQKW